MKGAALFSSGVSFREDTVIEELSFAPDRGALFSSTLFGVVAEFPNETVAVLPPDEKEKGAAGGRFCEASSAADPLLVGIDDASDESLDALLGVHEVFPGVKENPFSFFFTNMEIPGALERVALGLLPLFAPSVVATPKEKFCTVVSEEGAAVEMGIPSFPSDVGSSVSFPFAALSMPVGEGNSDEDDLSSPDANTEEKEVDDDGRARRAVLPPPLPLQDSIKL